MNAERPSAGVRRRGPDPAGGQGGACGRICRGGRRAHQGRGARAPAQRRAARRRARRPGLDDAGVVRRRGAVRPLHQRAVVAHADRLQRARPRVRRRRSSASCSPALRGELHDAYAVTEEHAGSDPSGIATTATRMDDGLAHRRREVVRHLRRRRVRVHRHGAARPEPTLFLVDGRHARHQRRRRPALHAHLSARPPDAALRRRRGRRGRGDRRPRRRRGAAAGVVRRGAPRDRGALRRRDDAAARGGDRVGDRRASRAARGCIDHQGISFPLADSAADCAAARLLGLEVARLRDAGADPKLVHAKASMAKLFASEAAGRCADRAVQTFGGRGYMRTNVAERFWRELRVDRIWEGTRRSSASSSPARSSAAGSRRSSGEPRSGASGTGSASAVRADRNHLARLLAPRSIAVVGATERPGAYGSEALLNLARLGFAGDGLRRQPGPFRRPRRPVLPLALRCPRRAGRRGRRRRPRRAGAAGHRGGGRARVRAARSSSPPASRGARGPAQAHCTAAGSRSRLRPERQRHRRLPRPRRPVGRHAAPHASRRRRARHPERQRRRQRARAARAARCTRSSRAATRAGAPVDYAEAVPSARRAAIALYLEADGDGERVARACCDADVRRRGAQGRRVPRGRRRRAGPHGRGRGRPARRARVLRGVRRARGRRTRTSSRARQGARRADRARRRPRRRHDLLGRRLRVAADLAETLDLPPPEPANAAALRSLLPAAATVANPLDYTSLLWDDRARACTALGPTRLRPSVLYDEPTVIDASVDRRARCRSGRRRPGGHPSPRRCPSCSPTHGRGAHRRRPAAVAGLHTRSRQAALDAPRT